MGEPRYREFVRSTGLKLAQAAADSPSQNGQDLFVLNRLRWKRGGYYVEFGATDGLSLSNTWLLDKKFGWRGILAEPGRVWRDRLSAQGRNAHLEFACVWTETGQMLPFSQTRIPEFSVISAFKDKDQHDRSNAKTYDVPTISLLDLLAKYDAPAVIDYLSLDTEGSELPILEAFDFAKYRFRCITCEHNYTPDREKIYELLTRNGYRRVMEKYSLIDDWYVSQD